VASANFDYIIVGAGSAGCILALRLAETPGNRVLLLEAGPHKRTKNVRIPAAFPKLYKSSLDWAYTTEPEPYCANRRMFWPRGRVLGGSHSMNAMLYIRGNRLDYDAWQDAGCTGWGFDEVLPYFKKTERNARGASEYHGADGPLHVVDQRSPYPFSHAVCAAAQEKGYGISSDFNAESQEGFGLYQTTQHNGARFSVADILVQTSQAKTNITTICDATVTKILFEGARAVGVQYRCGNYETAVHANREIVLSGGAINSPQLLMLSGIGPADHLRAFGINVLADLPGVGGNLQDHLIAGVCCRAKTRDTLDRAETIGNLLTYLLFKSGPFTSPIAESGGFVRTAPSLPAPDIQFHCAPGFFVEHGFTKLQGEGFTIGPTLLTPKSRGRIELAYNDPFKHPRIFANYLADPDDLRALVAGMRIARDIASANALHDYVGHEERPGPSVESEEAIGRFIRETVETLYHPVGTCAMGVGPEAVVDPCLRVRGLDNLRVIDASVMPIIPRGNTNAPTIMIAEKGADLLKAG